jgi:uncharacterized protein (TIGR01777 family)
MRIILAGGSGLIGHALSKELIEHGNEVVIFSRHPENVAKMPLGVKAVHWDGKTIQENWAAEIEAADAVINLTGENLSGESFLPTRWTKERKARLVNSRVDAGRVLTAAIENSRNKPKIFIQSSGISYYGTDPNIVFTEGSPGGNDFLANLCKDWEESTQRLETIGIRRVVIRNGVVLNKAGGALPRLILPFKLFAGGWMGSGKQVISWIHITDEVSAIRFLLISDEAAGIVNLTSPNPVTYKAFGKTVSKVMKRPYYLPVPSFAMKLAFGEVASVVLEGQSVLPEKLLSLGYKFIYPTLDSALKEILNPKTK